LPIGAVLSLFISIIIYSGWYYSDRTNKVIQISNDILENDKNALPKLTEKKYIIIEESFDLNKSVLAGAKKNNDGGKNTVFSSQAVVKDKRIEINEEINFKVKNRIEDVEPETNEMSAKANERNPNTEMILKAIGNSWVEIEDIDGNILMTRLMRPGETYVVPNMTGLTFNTGNAGALSLSKGDISVPFLGEVGEIIKARPLNIEAFSNQ
jgi:hypothetical protein